MSKSETAIKARLLPERSIYGLHQQIAEDEAQKVRVLQTFHGTFLVEFGDFEGQIKVVEFTVADLAEAAQRFLQNQKSADQ